MSYQKQSGLWLNLLIYRGGVAVKVEISVTTVVRPRPFVVVTVNVVIASKGSFSRGSTAWLLLFFAVVPEGKGLAFGIDSDLCRLVGAFTAMFNLSISLESLLSIYSPVLLVSKL